MLPAVEGRNIVIAGMGVVTPNGIGLDEFWNNSINGKSGIKSIEFDDYKTRVAGRIDDFDPNVIFDSFLEGKEKGVAKSRYAKAVQFGLVASFQAAKQANILGSDMKILPHLRERIGVQIGTGGGGIHEIGPDYLYKLMQKKNFKTSVLRIQPETVSTYPSMVFLAEGPSSTNVAACATGLDALASAVNLIRGGEADGMIAGGTESSLTPQIFEYFSGINALSNNSDPDKASRPFDKDRDGFVMSEGSGVVFLATEEFANELGAPVIARILGYGRTSDAFKATLPNEIGSVRAMRKALKTTNFSDEELRYIIKAHATSTSMGDEIEMKNIKQVFPNPEEIVIFAPKAIIGHTMGASGAIEAILGCLALNNGIVPPTLNLDSPIPEIGEHNVSKEEAKEQEDIARK